MASQDKDPAAADNLPGATDSSEPAQPAENLAGERRGWAFLKDRSVQVLLILALAGFIFIYEVRAESISFGLPGPQIQSRAN